jgi:putative cell wall-binding protein
MVLGPALVITVASSARAASGDFTVSPTTLPFADTFVGATRSLPVTVTNVSSTTQTPNFSGGAPLDATNFGASQNCAGVPLAPGASCVFTYTFEPASAGPKTSSTTIGIDSDNFSITMTGTGLFPITVTPTTLSFPNTAVGATSALPVTIRNISNVPQTPNYASGAPIDPTNFGGSQNCAGVTLAPGATCVFTYTFKPASVGLKTSSTTIQIDTVSFSITMSGTGGLTPAGTTAVVLGGADRIDTAILVSKSSFPTNLSANAVVLARADLFPDALAGAPLAVAKGGPLQLTSLSGPSFIDPRTVIEIQRVLSPGKTIFVLGGTSAIADSVVQQLQGLGYTVVRFGGVDRFQTAVLIAQQGLNNPASLFLVNGVNFPDALSAGPAAARVAGAILLTNNNVMPSSTSTYLASRTGTTQFAIGGPAAQAAPTATAVVGSDRYATAVATAQRFFANPTPVGIASGVAFPDGLTGGAHIGKRGGPLLLTDPNALPGNTQSYLQSVKATLTEVFVYGGTSAVATPVVTQINAAIA